MQPFHYSFENALSITVTCHKPDDIMNSGTHTHAHTHTYWFACRSLFDWDVVGVFLSVREVGHVALRGTNISTMT